MIDRAPHPVLSATVVACAVVGWSAFLHRESLPGPPHALADAAAAVPLALLAVLATRRLHPRLRALALAVATCALLIPGSLLHAVAHTATAPHSHASAPALDAAHALSDAARAFPAALLGAWVASGLPRRGQPRARFARPLGLATAMVVVAAGTGNQVAAATFSPFTTALPVPPTITSSSVDLVAREADVQVLPGAPTRMWTYNGTFPGPTIRRPAGEPTTVTLTNGLPPAAGELTLHHHGNHSSSVDDGQPHDFLIPPGSSRSYTYELVEDGQPERAALQWYHDHRMDQTGRNVWMGLAGMFIVEDEHEAALSLPRGEHDVPLMLVDRSFDRSNQLVYSFDPDGVRGNVVLVNGAPHPYAVVGDRKYRLRLLNASNARDFDLELSDGSTMTQIGTESGLLPAPIQRTHIRLGPAERADVVVDFSGRLGTTVHLRNRLPAGTIADIVQFRVEHDLTDDTTIPAALRPAPAFDASPPALTRSWTLDQAPGAGGAVWTINGRPFDPHRVDTAPINPRIGTTERWLFTNLTGVDHLVHIHDVDWRITSRALGVPPDPDARLAEDGLRETFRVRPGEVVEVMSRFTDHVGRYVLHCHILEHEDLAMMAQFEVEPSP